jgi:hypothetical protein
MCGAPYYLIPSSQISTQKLGRAGVLPLLSCINRLSQPYYKKNDRAQLTLRLYFILSRVERNNNSCRSLKRPLNSSPAKPDYTKRQKMDPKTRLRPANETLEEPVSKMGLVPAIPTMPPSLELITGVKADLRASRGHIGQEEVGIIGYVGKEMASVNGVIKQR